MRYKLFGRSGLRVSEICLGTMTFGRKGPRGTPADECESMFRRFVERGGNFIDTAPGYGDGNSEKILGRLVGSRRAHFVLATRLGVPETFLDLRSRMTTSLEGSLRRLGTDHIDLLWLDAWTNTSAFDEVMATLESFVSSGKVLYVGVADAPTWVVSQANTLADLHGWTPFVGLQFEYSLLERTAEQDSLPAAEALGLSMAPWGVLGAGLLTGKHDRNELAPFLTDRNQLAIERVQEIALDIGRPPSQVALNWVRQQGASIVPIVGARSPAQLVENLGALDFTLTRAHLTRLNNVSHEASAAHPSAIFTQELARA